MGAVPALEGDAHGVRRGLPLRPRLLQRRRHREPVGVDSPQENTMGLTDLVSGLIPYWVGSMQWLDWTRCVCFVVP